MPLKFGIIPTGYLAFALWNLGLSFETFFFVLLVRLSGTLTVCSYETRDILYCQYPTKHWVVNQKDCFYDHLKSMDAWI